MDGVGALMEAVKDAMADQGTGVPWPVALGTVVSVIPLSVTVGRRTLTREELLTEPRHIYVPKPKEPDNPHLLSVGDRVILVTEDGQTYILICKVVSP